MGPPLLLLSPVMHVHKAEPDVSVLTGNSGLPIDMATVVVAFEKNTTLEAIFKGFPSKMPSLCEREAATKPLHLILKPLPCKLGPKV